MHRNSIGDEGAKAIAEALKVNPVLTKLDLEYNHLGDAESARRGEGPEMKLSVQAM